MLTEERVDSIFKEMNSYILELANDPTSLGPLYFQDIIAKCRNYLNRVSLVISELNRDRLEVSSELRKEEAAHSLEYDNLLANDERVRRLASVEDRKATVGYLLREEQGRINGLKDQMHQLDAVYKVVSYRNRELHATMAAIKDQRRLIRIEVDTGSFYGDERVPSGGMAVDSNELNEEELANLFSEKTREQASVTEEITEETSEVAEQEELADLLSEKTKEKASATEEITEEISEVDSLLTEIGGADEEASTEVGEAASTEIGGVHEQEVLQFLDTPEESISDTQPVVDKNLEDTTASRTENSSEGESAEDILALLEEL
jgi:hypothetical protein